MKPFRAFVLVATLSVVGSVVGCSSSVVGLQDMREFASAKALWDARPFTDYTYEIRTSCFCPPEINAWTRVTVRNGAVVSAENVDPTQHYPITTLVYWVPVDSVFARLRQAMSRGSHYDSWLADIDVQYDATLGFPTYIEYREKPNVADAGSVHYLRNVRPLD